MTTTKVKATEDKAPAPAAAAGDAATPPAPTGPDSAAPAGPSAPPAAPSAAPPVAPPAAAKAENVAKADECNVDGCRRPPTTRGLCDAHWASRRGEATPKRKARTR